MRKWKSAGALLLLSFAFACGGGGGGSSGGGDPPLTRPGYFLNPMTAAYSTEGVVLGDLDGDGDLDLVAVLAGEDDNDSGVSWIRNELLPLGAMLLP